MISRMGDVSAIQSVTEMACACKQRIYVGVYG